MKENIFTVDLGDLKLTAKQRESINAAIQKAVTGVLAEECGTNLPRIVLIPVNPKVKGPIINGIIARRLGVIPPQIGKEINIR
ncbi:MAG: hypothetical protein RMK52_05405 [Chitinophagales bacterium]|nr:hypothetical protein [Chitinophagales bacterium]MDW8393665.1 hypothetical protein [Chitinophagales bacterium]